MSGKSVCGIMWPGEAKGGAGDWPKDVAVPMKAGGSSNQASLKLRPSPYEGMLYWSAPRSSKKELNNFESSAVRIGAPGAGSGGGSRLKSWKEASTASGGRQC